MEQHVEELERLKKSHEVELQTARMELQRAVEISKHKVRGLRRSFHSDGSTTFRLVLGRISY